jgi:transposase
MSSRRHSLDKLAANYLAFIQLASIRLWLRVNESTP